MPAQILLASRNKEGRGFENRGYRRSWLNKTARPQEFKAGCQAGIRPFLTKLYTCHATSCLKKNNSKATKTKPQKKREKGAVFTI